MGGRPELVVSNEVGKPQVILAVGDSARNTAHAQHVLVREAFPDSRRLIADRLILRLVIQHFLLELTTGRWFMPVVSVVAQLPVRHRDGVRDAYSADEVRSIVEVFRDLQMVRQLVIWEGSELTDEQVRQRQLPASGTIHHRY